MWINDDIRWQLNLASIMGMLSCAACSVASWGTLLGMAMTAGICGFTIGIAVAHALLLMNRALPSVKINVQPDQASHFDHKGNQHRRDIKL